MINNFFDNVTETLTDVPPSNIMNYDETNLADDPGRAKVIVKKGSKHPERIMNSSKSSVSVMYDACADGDVMPPYVVYKAQNMYGS